jgi:flagellar motor protein MotB
MKANLRRDRSTLHLQMGQETIYLLLTAAIFSTLLLIGYVSYERHHFEDPPIVTLNEVDGFYFRPGSPEVSPGFQRQLAQTIAPRLRAISERYGATVIEVIGHTDAARMRLSEAGPDNLDETLKPWLTGRGDTLPVAHDNVGLGMARAVAVARALRAAGIGRGFTIVPLSAGSFLKPNDRVDDSDETGQDERQRRIEIRLRRPRPR